MKNKKIIYYTGVSILLGGLLIAEAALQFQIFEDNKLIDRPSVSITADNSTYSGYLGVKEVTVTCDATKVIDSNGNVIYTAPSGYTLLGSTCYKQILSYEYPIETYDNEGNLIYVVDEGYVIKKFDNISRNDITSAIAASEDEMETETLAMGK